MERMSRETQSHTPTTATDSAPRAGADPAIDPDALRERYDTTVPAELRTAHADHLSALLAGEAAAGEAATIGRRTARAGVGAGAFLDTYVLAFDALISSAFADLDAGDDPEAAERRLRQGVAAALADMQSGIEPYASGGSAPSDGGSSTVGGKPGQADDSIPADARFGVGRVLEALPMPSFLVAPDHTVLAYNGGLAEMLGIDERSALGEDNRETIAAASYTDGRRHESLVDKVADAPRSAEERDEVERVEMPFFDGVVYEDTSTLLNERGEEIHIGFWAVPLFDESGELEAVLEVCDDRTEEVRHQESVAALVEEVTTTLGAIGDGDLSARADYEDEHGAVGDELLSLTDDVNEMAESFQALVERVDERATALSASIDEAVASANRIDEQVESQSESLGEVAEEIDSFSATMEEVAASSNEVASAAEQALSAAERGLESGEDAREAADDVLELSDELLESVTDLESRMDDIGDVVEVISDVAEQTNVLALNANIEAARAGEAGDGFAVVAQEVEELATETRDHADDITDRIGALREQALDTVESVEASHGRVERVDAEMEATLGSLREIADAIETATDGINEVADANDDQAATVEEVAATVENVTRDAEAVDETADEIVREMAAQSDAVEDLAERVGELTGEAVDGARRDGDGSRVS